MLMAMSLPLMISCGGGDSGDESSVPPSEYPDNPDPYDVLNFKDLQVAAICVANFDLNKDGKITYAEAAAVKEIGNVFRGSNIVKFDELRYFSSLSKIVNTAFGGCENLTSITIPNSVKGIGLAAFENCKGLTSIIIPNSVTTLGVYVFHHCENLASVTIGSGVKEIHSFGTTPNLSAIIVDKGNTVYDSRDNCNAVIETATNKLIRGCKNTVIPNGVTTIGLSAFSVCYNLKSINIPNSVSSIEANAFNSCDNLATITIPNGVTSIESETFYGCHSLTSIAIPNSVTSIGSGAFQGCRSLTSIPIPSGVTFIGNEAFKNCKSLTSITIPSGVTSIGYAAFADCSSLTSVHCKSKTPPSLIVRAGSDYKPVFDENTYSSATLYVPQGSVEAYKSAEEWKKFQKIVEE